LFGWMMGWMTGRMDGKLHFIPTSFTISDMQLWKWQVLCYPPPTPPQPATSELPWCRFAWTTGRMDRGTTGRIQGKLHDVLAIFSYCVTTVLSVRIKGKLHSSFNICNVIVWWGWIKGYIQKLSYSLCAFTHYAI
jgi:hypothetical protein